MHYNMDYSPFSPTDTVLVTGASSHVAQHIVDQLLAKPSGPYVRATVETEESALLLESAFLTHVRSGRLLILFVPDVLAEGAFNEVVRDVTHIAHLAAPMAVRARDVEKELLIPAIGSTTGILKAALKETSIKSVVLTSSFGAILDPAHGFRPGYTYTSDDWNPITYEEAADPDLDLGRWEPQWRPFISYMASKTVAEKAAWDLYNREMPDWGLTVLNPVYIGGPCVVPLTPGPQCLSWSNTLIWTVALGGNLAEDYPFWVDVRDVAKAHVEALVRPQVWGRRWILASGRMLYSEVIMDPTNHHGNGCFVFFVSCHARPRTNCCQFGRWPQPSTRLFPGWVYQPKEKR